MQLVLLTVPSTRDYQASAVHYLGSGHVDGALFVSMHGRRPLDLEHVGIPVVLGGRPVYGEVGGRFSYVDADNRGGAANAVRYLIESGRSTIATVAGPKDMTAGADRLKGYREVMFDAGRSD